jgi:cell division protein FtsQ
MPLEMPDPDADELPRKGGARFDGPTPDWQRGPWWKPSGALGRTLLGLGILIVLGGLIATGSLLKAYLNRDERFRIAGVDNIEAAGLSEVSRADVLPVFGEDIGRNIFFVPLNERRKQLESIPWVQEATVMRLLPDRIRISVVERKPVAFVRQGQQIGLVDANGVLLSMPAATMAQHHYSFPVVTGIDPHDQPAVRKNRMAVYERLVSELDANNQHLSEQISEIDLTDPEDARVLMPEQGADILAHFGEDRFLERYQRYKAHIAEWRQQYPNLAAADLRYDQQVVLEMAPGTSTAAADQGASNASEAKPPDAKAAANPPVAAATAPKPVSAAKAAPGKPGTKPADKVKQVKAGAKPGAKAGKGPAKPKSAATKLKAAKAKAAKETKKRAEAKRAALHLNRQKPAPRIRPATIVSQGQ